MGFVDWGSCCQPTISRVVARKDSMMGHTTSMILISTQSSFTVENGRILVIDSCKRIIKGHDEWKTKQNALLKKSASEWKTTEFMHGLFLCQE